MARIARTERIARLVVMIARLLASLPLTGCAVFAGVLFTEFEADIHGESSAPRHPRSVAAHSRSPAAASSVNGTERDEQVATALARPLFDPTRRPPAPAESKMATELGLESLRLAGIITAPDRRLAIFAVAGAQPLALGEGEAVSGWQIESITPRQVSLTAFGEMRTLQPQSGPATADAMVPPKLSFDRVLPNQQTRDDE